MVVKMKDVKGQALFEFIFFIVPLIVVVGVMHNVVSSINGSINQQKSTRSYLFYRLANNSFAPSVSILKQLRDNGISSVGLYFLGWREKSISKMSYATCYKMPRIFSCPTPEQYDEFQNEEKSEFVKVLTAFGTCVNSYSYGNQGFEENYFKKGVDSCSLIK